jgi:hypothetical protein
MGRRKPRRSTTTRTTTSAVSSTQTAQIEASRLLNLAQEYHYVITDLQRTGIIAGVLILGLVILSFVLR